MGEEDRLTRSNRSAWDIAAGKYAPDLERDVAFLRSGGVALMSVERELLGDLSRCARAIHLQCSHGLDALSLLNLGVQEVVGVDISEAMLAQASEKSRRLNARARWVRADVLDVPHDLDASADLVYTGGGALCWVMDLDRWAAVVRRLLRPGGRLFVHEGHPLNWVWDEMADRHHLASGASYFDTEPRANAGFPARAVRRLAPPGQTVPPAWERQWTLGQVVTAVAGAGLRVRRLEEYPDQFWPQFDRIPAPELTRLPHTFALIADAG